MIIECDRCEVRGIECGDCVVSVLLGLPGGPVEFDVAESRALGVLAGGGLVPPLRLVTAAPAGADHDGTPPSEDPRARPDSRRPPRAAAG